MPKMKLQDLKTVLSMPYFNVYSAMYENSVSGHRHQYDLPAGRSGKPPYPSDPGIPDAGQ